MEEPGRLQSMGLLRVRHDWATSLSLFTLMHWRRKWQPTPVFLPGESQEWGSLVGCRLWGRSKSNTTKVIQQQRKRLSSSSSSTREGKFLRVQCLIRSAKILQVIQEFPVVGFNLERNLGRQMECYWSMETGNKQMVVFGNREIKQ